MDAETDGLHGKEAGFLDVTHQSESASVIQLGEGLQRFLQGARQKRGCRGLVNQNLLVVLLKNLNRPRTASHEQTQIS